MATCNENFPTTDKIYIIDNSIAPVTRECIKNNMGNYYCDGLIQDGFWKLIKGENDVCRWVKCKLPFKADQYNQPIYKDGILDTSDYSDCVVTNYPYYFSNDGSSCSVHNIFNGDTVEDKCQADSTGANEMCCTTGEICTSDDCINYKPYDKYLVSTGLDYDCKNGRCVPVVPGQGTFTNPFCDYQCARMLYPKNFTCLNGYCQPVSDPSSYPKNTFFDNPLCDSQCDPKEDAIFNCDSKSRICVTAENKSGKYKKYSDCYKDCQQPDISFSGLPSDNKTKETTSSKIIKFILIVALILFNILIIYIAVYFFNKSLKKNNGQTT